MVSGAFGLPGSGKSLWLGSLADRALQGKPLRVGSYSLQSIPGQKYERVYTNFSFPGAYMLDWDTLGLCDYHDCLMLLDEIMMYADSRDFKSFTKEHKFFFSQHRKMRIDFCWTSQLYDDCDKKIRGITQNFYYIRRAWLPGFTEVLPIESFFDIKDGQIRSGQQFSRRVNRSLFRRKPLFEKVDSYETIARFPDTPPPSDLW